MVRPLVLYFGEQAERSPGSDDDLTSGAIGNSSLKALWEVSAGGTLQMKAQSIKPDVYCFELVEASKKSR